MHLQDATADEHKVYSVFHRYLSDRNAGNERSCCGDRSKEQSESLRQRWQTNALDDRITGIPDSRPCHAVLHCYGDEEYRCCGWSDRCLLWCLPGVHLSGVFRVVWTKTCREGTWRCHESVQMSAEFSHLLLHRSGVLLLMRDFCWLQLHLRFSQKKMRCCSRRNVWNVETLKQLIWRWNCRRVWGFTGVWSGKVIIFMHGWTSDGKVEEYLHYFQIKS